MKVCTIFETWPRFGPCLGHPFGLFVGRPLGALGLSYAPLPGVSALVGWMQGRITRENGGEVAVGALVLGVSATVDLLR